VPIEDDIVAACLMTAKSGARDESRRKFTASENSMDIVSHTITNLIIFVLAIYVGYHVVWTSRPRCTRR
jgi:NAD/NADP transhydrogenase alpha subunit